jgi:AraC-like DNA-binding protein
MQYREILPPSALSSIVRFFWILEYDGALGKPVKYKLLAEGFPGLIFFFNSQYGALNGQTTEHKEFIIPGEFKMMGVYLHPYALSLLFNIPANELIHQQVTLDTIGKNLFKGLEERLFDAPDDEQRINLMIRFLYEKLNGITIPSKGFQACIQHVVNNGGSTELDTLSRLVGISHRQLERRFKKEAGFSPKLFSRLMRFQACLRYAKKETNSMTDLAYLAGYFDQSHFIREFKEFSGICPKQYFKLAKQNVADNFIQLPH